jgi:hypothetical protein
MASSAAAAELTLQDRGILASSAYAAYLDQFSGGGRILVSTFEPPVLTPRQRQYYSRGRAYQIEWQDYGQPLPLWFDPLMQGLVDLLTLPENWDSYGAPPIVPKIINDAMSLMNGVLGPSSPAPRVVPLSSGGLQLEWHRNGIDLEVVFDRDEQAFFYLRNRQNDDESEHSLPGERELLRSIIGAVE